MDADPILPALRSDLEFHLSPDKPEGAPEWLIKDPLHSTFEKVSWQQMEILRLLSKPIPLSRLHNLLQKRTTLRLQKDELLQFCKDLSVRGLTVSSQHLPVEELVAREQAKKIKPLKWLLGHYLYFRVPLLHPDAFLTRTLPKVKLFANRFTGSILLILGFLSILILSQNFENYINTFPYFFNWQGALTYGLAIAGVKAIHEFSHAYCCKAMGNRVPTMGLAFIVMWPVPFCDVTDSWRMHSRKKRLLISASGVIAEICIASVAIVLWALLPDGTLRSIMFILSSISVLGTLAVNLNPAMRFDGYYIFSDLIRIDNLQQRAFAFFLWSYRRKFLGIQSPCPEPGLSPARSVLLHVYAVYAVLYRFFLYLGIAALVYYAFNAKLLGITLFLVEIVFFLVRPAYNEIYRIWKMKKMIRPNLLRITLWLILCGLVLWLAVPVKRRQALSAISVPEIQQILYAPTSGILTEIQLKNGATVTKGQPLATISDELLAESIKLTRLELRLLNEETENLSSTPKGRQMLHHKAEEKIQLNARLQGLLNQKKRNHIKAGIAASTYHVSDKLRDGLAVPAGLELGRLAIPGNIEIKGYISQKLINRITEGSSGYFYPDDNSGPIYGRIEKINKTRKEFLPYPALASIQGGDIPVTPASDNQLKMVDGYYEFTFKPYHSDTTVRFEQPGKVWIETEARSILLEWYNHAKSVLIRESGF